MRAHLSHPSLTAELLLLMIAMPVALLLWLPVKFILVVIWLAAWYCVRVLRRMDGTSTPLSWNVAAVNWPNLRPILLRLAGNTLLLAALTAWLKPELLLGFVRTNPAFWAAVMLLYPLLSVVPQEIIFRTYFFRRYAPLLPTPWRMIGASAIAFGLAHIVFQNWVAPLLCAVGGALFASTYLRHRSLLLVTLEHALYGDMVFTLGLGRYFYHGAVGH